MNNEACFHCGETIPDGVHVRAVLGESHRPVCCIGCKAAAEIIVDAGLQDFYRFRTSAAPRPDREADDVWATYDRAEMHATVLGREDDLDVVNVLIEGTRCSACGWLIGERLRRIEGVRRADVNPATSRAQIVFSSKQAPLSHLLRAIAELGYRPHVLGSLDSYEIPTRERRSALKRLAVAGIGMMQVMMIATALYIGAIDGMDPSIREYLRIISLIVTIPVLAYSGQPFVAGAVRALGLRRVTMDVPVAAALLLAFGASSFNTFSHRGDVYFDSVTMFTFLLLIGRYVEMTARHRAGSTTDALLRLIPATVVRLTNERCERVPVAQLRCGDRILVAAGECHPADGRVVEGESHSDEALLTGESTPVRKTVGDPVIAGTINVGAPVEIVLEAVGQATVLAGVVRLLERGQAERPQIARLADIAARRFVGRVLIAAVMVAIGWLVVDPSRAFEATLAVLVVSCPCALSLAAPTVVTAATSALARAGVLVTHADALESLACADTVLFDKTGTLTVGAPRLLRTHLHRGTEGCALEIAAALEATSTHPLAHAFSSSSVRRAEGVQVVPGQGLEGSVAGVRVRIGTGAFVAGLAGPRPDDLEEATIGLGDSSGWIATFEVGDAVRAEAARTIEALADLGLRPVIASGDHAPAVAAVARRLGVREWYARRLPSEKLEIVAALSHSGARILAVGDGINDAPSLGHASVSAALGSGSALAQTSADLILLRGDLATLPLAVRTARRAVRVLRQNLAWSAAYNLTALPLAALGLVPPWLAAIGMSASSLVVVLNALRLTRTPQPRAQRHLTAPISVPA